MRVLIVEDEPEVAFSLARGLNEAGVTADYALDGRHALTMLEGTLPYDVAILDIMLGGEMDGLALCREMRSHSLPTSVLMLTARDGLRDRLIGFDAGADDYLPKPFHFDEVLARVRALSRRRGGDVASGALTIGDLRVDSLGRRAEVQGKTLELTRREYDLLELFARHPGQVLSKEQLHEAIWGDDQTRESGLVEAYTGRVRRKLQSTGTSTTIENCRGVGYRLVAGNQPG